jgi:hypothetical protein
MITAEEMIHHLRFREPRHGRQDAKGVRCQEYNGARMPRHPRIYGIGNKINGISRARILGDGVIAIIYFARRRVHHHVFHDRAKTDGVLD